MIKNERQYHVTKTQLGKFESALNKLNDALDFPPRLREIQESALRNQIAELREELTEYEELRAGKQPAVELGVIAKIPEALIRARIAAGLSQRELAERLGLKEQQIQRYEATDYQSASLSRVEAIVKALESNDQPARHPASG